MTTSTDEWPGISWVGFPRWMCTWCQQGFLLLFQTRIQESIKAAINGSQHELRLIHVEIRPRLLVPDTNCFIDHLHSIESLLEVRRFTVVVPLIGRLCYVYTDWSVHSCVITSHCLAVDLILCVISLMRIAYCTSCVVPLTCGLLKTF